MKSSFDVISIESFSVRVVLRTNDRHAIPSILAAVNAGLPENYVQTDFGDFRHEFFINKNGRNDYSVLKNGVAFIERAELERATLYLGSHLRMAIAESAQHHVFVHSGAVAVNGVGILIPGDSYSGKTTLTAALLKCGADYLSDEYAVLDSEANVHPFPKTLSIRGIIDEDRQVEFAPEVFGAKISDSPLPVGLVVKTHFEEGGVWAPKRLSPVQGVFELIKTTLPVRNSPELSLRVLRKVAERAVVWKTVRGEADEIAPRIVEFVRQRAGVAQSN